MRRVLIGVCGGIASYKIPELVRNLKKEGFSVKVVLTPFAEKFVGKLTFKTISDGAFTDEDWEDSPLLHIELARWAELFLIAPATANTIAKLSQGIADNLLSTTFLAFKGKVLIAPAMNTVMYKSPQVRRNLELLKEYGAEEIEPEFGVLACEEIGEGKLASLEKITERIYTAFENKLLEGKRVLITCGATREYLDPVRFISNESSGEMGFALARVAKRMGAKVKVIAGFTTAKEPPEIDIIRVRTTEEMRKEVFKLFPWADIVIMNAAVSDFRPKAFSREKIKKKEELILELERNPDILEELGRIKGNKYLVGFALESENILEYAREKLKRKNLDMVVANPVKVMGNVKFQGFVLIPEGIYEIKEREKVEAAREILKLIAEKVT